MSKQLRCLIACEMSGRVRTAFAHRGWDAWSCDLLPDETRMWNPDLVCKHDRTCDDAGYLCPDWGRHHQGDVLELLKQDSDWDLVIAHPPCTDLSQAGARYWKQKQADGRQKAAIEFFMALYETPNHDTFVVIENPNGVMSKPEVFRPPEQVIEPFWFGDPQAKKTCLWYREAWVPSKFTRDLNPDSLPLLVADKLVEPTVRTVTGGGSWRTDKANGKTGMNNWEDSQGRARRRILRSITSAGVARAMADQFGPYIEERRGS